jgi:hypothetical protein
VFPDVRVVAYADDVRLQGPPDAAIEAFRLLVTTSRRQVRQAEWCDEPRG